MKDNESRKGREGAARRPQELRRARHACRRGVRPYHPWLQTLLRMPIITVTFIDEHRQWFKSRQGMKASETPRETAFCNEAIKQEGPFVVEDALADPRFAENPSVTGEPHIRFYGSVPLRTRDGHNIGTLCAIDTKPRLLEPAEISILSDLAHIVMDEARAEAPRDHGQPHGVAVAPRLP